MGYLVADVDFFILLDNHPVLVTTRASYTLLKLFSNLRKDPEAAQYLPKQVLWRACDFYRLKNPVPLRKGPIGHGSSSNLKDLSDEVKEACLQEDNKEIVNALQTYVEDLAEELSDHHIYLVIQIPDREWYHFEPLDVS